MFEKELVEVFLTEDQKEQIRKTVFRRVIAALNEMDFNALVSKALEVTFDVDGIISEEDLAKLSREITTRILDVVRVETVGV